MTDRNLRNAVTIIFTLIAFNCAGQVAPTGGPPDKTPPSIKQTSPQPMSINFKGDRFLFAFDKYVDRRSFQESFFISPAVAGITYDWSGKEVEVAFEDTLRPNTTYIITIGTDLLDTRGNRLEKAFSLPFSTGGFIDSCAVSGSVADEKAVGIMIFAYALDGRNPDTLNPTRVRPDFLTQTGRDGTFLLPYLPAGKFRVVAVRDEYKNLLYDIQTDQFGVYTSDILLSAEKPLFSGVQFKLSIEDTSAPFLSSARSIDQSHLLIRFSEAMNEESVLKGEISLFDTLSGTTLSVLDVSLGERPVTEAQLVTSTQDFGRAYRMRVSAMRDIAGNVIAEPRNMADFDGSSTYDTSRPVFDLIYPPKKNNEITTTDTIRIFFSEAVKKPNFEAGLAMTDSAKTPVEISNFWPHSRELWISPKTELKKGFSYTLTVRMDSLADLFGNSYEDSTVTFSLETMGEENMSGISGILTDEGTGNPGAVYITANNISVSDYMRVLRYDTLKSFAFENIREGQYTLWAFIDEDSSGSYSFGKPYPFARAERFSIYGDTLKLRARWPLEGVNIKFR